MTRNRHAPQAAAIFLLGGFLIGSPGARAFPDAATPGGHHVAAVRGRESRFVPPELEGLAETDGLLEQLEGRIRRAETHPTRMQDGFDVLHYDLAMAISLDSLAIAGVMTLKARTLQDGLSALALDLRDTTLTCDGVEINGTPAPFTHADDVVEITISPPLATADTFSVTVRYSGWPTAEGYASFDVFDHDGVPIIQTLSEPYHARSWWPCKDRPDDKATATLHFTVPDSMIVGSNGLLTNLDHHRDGRATYHWTESYPIATYLVSIAATNYVIIEDVYESDGATMPVTHFVYPEDREDARIDFAVTPAMLALFADRFGEYPFIEEKYGMAEFQHAGAIEHQTLTSMRSGCVTGRNLCEHIVAHELAHQWWGDAVTPKDWKNIWLNEGFASYSQVLWEEERDGHAAYLEWFNSRAYLTFAGSLYDPIELFSRTTYLKGAFVLHMLRGILGDDLFFEALRRYRFTHEYDVATTEDFQTAVEATAGAPLDWFFDEWVYGEGRPTYVYSWDQTPAGGGAVVNLLIEQVQEGPLFRMPLVIRLYSQAGPEDARVENTRRLERFILRCGATVDSLRLDPDGWALKWIAGERPFEELADRLDRPTPFTLSPNPARDFVALSFRSAPPDFAVYDAGGRLVRRLAPRSGWSVWDTRDESGRRVASGLYWIRGGDAARGVTVLR